MNRPTAVEFPGSQRIHVALQVADLGRSLPFYEVLLGVAPTKVREGYAKFEPRDPSVNLTLNQVPAGTTIGGGVSHFGVQVRSTAAVQEALRRFEAAGLSTLVEEQTACCHAVQDKVWVADPDGHRWEVFVVTEAEAPVHAVPSVSAIAGSPVRTGDACCPALPASAAAGAAPASHGMPGVAREPGEATSEPCCPNPSGTAPAARPGGSTCC